MNPCILFFSDSNTDGEYLRKKKSCHVQLSHVQLFANPWTAALQGSLSFTNSQSLLKLMSIESVMPSNHLILCCPLLLLPSIFPSTRVFSSELVLHIRWPKYWSFSFSISPSNEYSGLISFRIVTSSQFEGKSFSYYTTTLILPLHAPLTAQLLRNPPAMQETWVRSLCWEDSLEKGKATHSSILAWRIP